MSEKIAAHKCTSGACAQGEQRMGIAFAAVDDDDDDHFCRQAEETLTGQFRECSE